MNARGSPFPQTSPRHSRTPNQTTNMNKHHSKPQKEIHDKLQTLQGELEEIMKEEETYNSKLPESMGNRIEQTEYVLASMAAALTHLKDATDAMESIE